MPKVHRVCAPLAVVTDATGHIQYLYQGSLVPPGLASAAELKRLVGLELLEPIELAVPDDAPPPGATSTLSEDDPGQTAPPVGQTPPGTPAPERPANTATKVAWVKYAVARGLTQEEAEKLSRDDLVDRYPAA